MRQAILHSRNITCFSKAQEHCPLVKCHGLQLAGRGEVVVDKQASSWPAATTVLCWYCAHHFDTPPVPRPVSFDPTLKRWVVRGNYCSWGCAAADCHTQRDSGHLHNLHQAVHGRERSIRPVPPRHLLKAFGGPMTIEEFRGTEQEFRVVPNRLVVVEAVSVHAESKMRRPLHTTVDLTDVTSTNEVLKLKRTKPLMAGKGLAPVHAKVVIN